MRTFVVDAPKPAALRALNYSPTIERIRRHRSRSTVPLRALAKRFGDAYGTMFTRNDCHPDYGVRLLSQTDTFAAEPLGRVIRRDSMPHPDLHEIKRWQILVSGAGQMGDGNLFGRVIIADNRLEGCFVGPDTFVIESEEPGSDLNLWTYAVLNSSVGLQGIRASAYGTSIPHLRPDLLGSTPIPLAAPDLVARVANCVRSAVTSREDFLRHLRRARTIVESVPPIREAHEMCVDRKRRSVAWEGPFPTLGAWNFAGAGGALKYLSREYSGRVLDALGEGGMYYGERSARIACSRPFGVPFVAQRDAFLIKPIPRQVLLPGARQELLRAPEGSLMIAGRGTLGEGEIFGRSVQTTGTLAELVFTEDMLRLTVREGQSNLLYAYLSTHLGVQLIRTAAVGTKILKLRDDLMSAIPVPELSHADQAALDADMNGANQSRALSDVAESEAIRIIEEEVLPQWLA